MHIIAQPCKGNDNARRFGGTGGRTLGTLKFETPKAKRQSSQELKSWGRSAPLWSREGSIGGETIEAARYTIHTGNTITAFQAERQSGRGLSSTAVAIGCATTSEVDLYRSCRRHALNNTLLHDF